MIENMISRIGKSGPRIVARIADGSIPLILGANGNNVKISAVSEGNVVYDTLTNMTAPEPNGKVIQLPAGQNYKMWIWFGPGAGPDVLDAISLTGGTIDAILEWTTYPFSRLQLHEGTTGVNPLKAVPEDLPVALRSLDGIMTRAVGLTGDLTKWDTSRITSMRNALNGCSSISMNSLSWNTSNVTDMANMLMGCSGFSPYNGVTIDTRKVKDFTNMFRDIPNYFDVTSLDFSSATAVTNMFNNCGCFMNAGSWKFPNLRDASSWFERALYMGGSGFGFLDMSKITSFRRMFANAGTAPNAIGNWKTGNVTDMSEMFIGCSSFEGNCDAWDVSKVTTMKSMFRGIDVSELNFSAWDVSNVKDMSYMFAGGRARRFNGQNRWNSINVTTMRSMFQSFDCDDGTLAGLKTNSVVDMSYMFSGFQNLWDAGVATFNTSNVVDMSNMFYGCGGFQGNLGSWDVSKVTDMSSMFVGCAYFFGYGLPNWNVGNLKYMDKMFYNTYNVGVDLSGWNVSKVISHVDYDYSLDSWPQEYRPHFPS